MLSLSGGLCGGNGVGWGLQMRKQTLGGPGGQFLPEQRLRDL